ncbi:MAG TPA: alpha/beta hydrolase domain-containing protein [Vicinamibacterales bacterium]|nr:alpha/beta hydrolase domain-containing protein [Vicinamibacterales bacterium]
MRRLLIASILALVSPGLAAIGSPVADVPTPKVTRLPAGTPGAADHDYPFFAADIVLANYGFIEEEFVFEGAANTYATPAPDGTVEVAQRDIPYRTRLIVRRPLRQTRFNGVVFVEWFNVTNQYDTDVLWLYQKEFLIREGYAWVGVSAQNVGLSAPNTGLKAWSPKRYGRLDVTNSGTITGDALAADIYSQAAAAIRRVPEVLGGLKIREVIAAGQSQSAGRLGPYLNGPHHRSPIYDAALLTVNNQAIRPDITIPVIKVLSETERDSARRQPDLDRVRVWPVAGSTHSEQYSLLSRAAFLKRDLGLEAVDACATPARSRVEIRYVYNAATEALVRWRRAGVAPPHAPAFVYDESAAAPAQPAGGRGGRGGGPPEKPVKRDSHGNILGGIRTAEIAAPVARESGELCGLGGTHVPFDTATLNALYPSHADYVAKVTRATRQLVDAGFLLSADAALTIDKARRSIYGSQLVCGPLCADVRQFPSNPSSMLLANQTAYLMIKDGGALIRILDGVTRSIAEGDTEASDRARRYAAAVQGLERYIAGVRASRGNGNVARETEALLVDQANVLIARLRQ